MGGGGWFGIGDQGQWTIAVAVRRGGGNKAQAANESPIRQDGRDGLLLTKVESVFGMRDLLNRADEVALLASW